MRPGPRFAGGFGGQQQQQQQQQPQAPAPQVVALPLSLKELYSGCTKKLKVGWVVGRLSRTFCRPWGRLTCVTCAVVCCVAVFCALPLA
jgi:hypothetical protein